MLDRMVFNRMGQVDLSRTALRIVLPIGLALFLVGLAKGAPPPKAPPIAPVPARAPAVREELVVEPVVVCQDGTCRLVSVSGPGALATTAACQTGTCPPAAVFAPPRPGWYFGKNLGRRR